MSKLENLNQDLLNLLIDRTLKITKKYYVVSPLPAEKKMTELDKWLSEVKERLAKIKADQEKYGMLYEIPRNPIYLKKAVMIIERLKHHAELHELQYTKDRIEINVNEIVAMSDEEVWK